MRLRDLRALLAMAILMLPVTRSQAQSGRPEFEVASLKSNSGCENTPRAGSLSPSPGLLEMPCVTLQALIQAAYGTFGDGVTANMQPLLIEGGPTWMTSDHYRLEAKAEGPARTELMAGPMLQELLEERFQLKTHRQTREMPVYSMTVTRSGLKVEALAEGACIPIDPRHLPPQPAPGQPPPNLCGFTMMGFTPKGNTMMEVRGVNMTQFAQRLSGRVDRLVIDKTGVAGKFNFHLEYALEPSMRGPAAVLGRGGDTTNAGNPSDLQMPGDPAPTIFGALQDQIGLRLSSDKGLVEFLVIDHVQKPTGN
jgi:uncharacterized protein (TIGR03435 family)